MRFFEFNENKMKGGTDLNKFMGYKGKDLADPSNRKLPKMIAIDPFKNQGAQLKKLGSKKQGYGYYDEEITVEDTQDFHEEFGELGYSIDEADMFEAEYRGRKVKLNKPMRGDVKKFKVYVKNKKGIVIKVNFGDPNMRIKKSNPARRRSFRARHNCDNPGPKTKARYWSCRKW